MELEERIKLYRNRLSREFSLSGEYEGHSYEVVAESTQEETKAFGESELTKKLVLLSLVPEKLGPEYVQSEIEKIPQAALSGFRSISKNKTTFFIRVFLMENIPFDLIQKVRDFDFSRSEQGAFNYMVHAGIVLVDLSGAMIYSNGAGSQFCSFFKVLNPVETKDGEENTEKDLE